MRGPRFIARWIERERDGQRAPNRLERWFQAQADKVTRLPRWLSGTWMVSSVAFAIWCAVYDHGLTPLFRDELYVSTFSVIGPAVLTSLLLWALLFPIAMLIKPRDPPNLPTARINE